MSWSEEGGAILAVLAKRPSMRSASDLQQVSSWLKVVCPFLTKITIEALEYIAKHIRSKTVEAGSVAQQQGESQQAAFILLKGTGIIVRANGGGRYLESAEVMKLHGIVIGQAVRRVRHNYMWGEMTLVRPCRCENSLVAETGLEIVMLDSELLIKALNYDPTPGMWARMQWISDHDIAKPFGVDLTMISAVAAVCSQHHWGFGHKVLEQGHKCPGVIFVRSGSVAISTRVNGLVIDLCIKVQGAVLCAAELGLVDLSGVSTPLSQVTATVTEPMVAWMIPVNRSGNNICFLCESG